MVTAGLGGMGGAQPLAVTMNGGCALCVEVDLQRIERRIETGYLDERAADLDDALRRLDAARGRREALSIGLLGNAAEVLPELVRRGASIDVVTDQTSAHDPLNGYVPAGLTVEQADALRASDPDDYLRRVGESAVAHVAAIRLLQEAGAEAFDYGNALRGLAAAHGDADAFAYPGFVPAYIRPLFCEGKGPFRWVALSGDPADIHATDEAILDLFGDQEHIARWIALARERVHFQGLPARICWLGYGERDRAGLRFNEMVASGELRGPIVIGRDHLDAGSVASPQRETESMADGSDAVADWPLLNAMVNVACGASWVSIHHGGGVGMGLSIHAGQVCVADGTPEAGERIRRVLTADPGMGIVRHADAGEPLAVQAAERSGVRMPMLDPGMTVGRRQRRAEVLRVPTGLPYLRHDRAGELALDPAPLTLEGDRIAAFEAAARGRRAHRRHGLRGAAGLRRLPHAPALRRLARGRVRAEGHRRALRGDRALGRRASPPARAPSPPPPTTRCWPRRRALAAEMLAAGTTAFESKTGYGLSVDAEARAVRLGRELGADRVTGLFAHAVPEGYDRDDWMDCVDALAASCDVDALDIYVESVAFTNENLAHLGAIAARQGVPLRAHVEQFNANRSVPVALAAGARSVDHLACLHPDDIAPLAAAECAAVLLPGAEFLGAERVAPARELADAGAICVLGTDLNPGTSPVSSLPVVIGLAVRRYGWSVREALLACTLNAAWVLGLSDELGSLEVGKRADVVLLDTPAAHLPYRFGRNPVCLVIRAGEVAYVRPDAAWRLAS